MPLLKIKTTWLWTQFKEKHNPPTVKSLPAGSESGYFDEHLADQDTREGFKAARRQLVQDYGESLWDVPDKGQAAQEALWIRAWGNTGQCAEHLREAGYTIPTD